MKAKNKLLIMAAGAAAAATAAPPAGAQGTPGAAATPLPLFVLPSSTAARFGVSASVDGWFPALLDGASDVSYAAGGTAQLSYAPLPFFEALARAGVRSMRLESNESLLYVGGSAGLGFAARFFERVSVGGSGFAGLGKVLGYQGGDYGLYELGARLEAGVRLTAALTVGVSAGYERLANPNSGTFMDAISAGIRLKLSPAELAKDRANLAITKVETQAIFPVFRSWYDSEPLGAVTVRNDEDGPVQNVRVSFYAPEYMGGPRLCAVVPAIEKGQSAVVPLYAVFDERILSLTENGKTTAAVDVDYSFLGSRRKASEGLTLSLHHRNAMSWEDDRRAAAFVSPTDPAALWFSRYAASVVRDRIRTELPPNLQFALGIFESLKLYGINYVIDPNSSYVDMSENAAVVDYLQYPSQTLMYRGGDCDDLSILYCSLLESSGIETAFITIPGHIYMAFDLGLGEAEARDKFFDPGLLIFRDGRAWAPVEITMVKDGFVKAWRVGAKQWIDNDRAGSAAFYPVREAWKRYQSSGLQDAAARFTLPDETRAMAAFDDAVDRFVSRELEPVVAEYEKKLATGREPATLNEYGAALAKVGMLDAAWEKFAEAAKAGYAWSWNNLASIAFARKDYELSYSYYQWTTTLLPGDPVAVLGMARSAYELGRYSESGTLYAGLKLEAPLLADRYGYLASAYGGQGRAWSMADRLASSVWSRPGLSFVPAVAAPATEAVPAEPPVAEAAPAAAVPSGPEASTGISAPVAPTAPVASTASVVPVAPGEASAPPETAAPVALSESPAPAEIAETVAPIEPSAHVEASTPAVLVAPVEATSNIESTAPDALPDAPDRAAQAIPSEAIAPIETATPTAAGTAQAAAPIASPVEAPAPTATVPVQPSAQAAHPKPAFAAPPAIVEKPPVDTETAAAASASIGFPASIPAPPAAVSIAPDPQARRAVPEPAPSAPVLAPIAEPPSAVADEEAELAAIAARKAEAQALAARSAEFTAAVPAKEEASESVPPDTTITGEPPFAGPVSPAITERTPERTPQAVAATGSEASPAIESVVEDVDGNVTETAIAKEPAAVTSAPTEGMAPEITAPAEPVQAAVTTELPIVTVEPIPGAAFVDLDAPDVSATAGSWKRDANVAFMTDPSAKFAKLVVGRIDGSGRTVYEFNARSAGTGWVGFGLHLHGRGEWKLKGYGGGDSILVWVTSDPKANGDAAPRLQVYRSRGEVDMTMIASKRIAGSAFDLRSYRVDYDPASGVLAVAVDGAPALELTGLESGDAFRYAAFRALNLAEFSDLTIRPQSHSGPAAEPSHD